MPAQKPPPPAKPMPDAEREYTAALEHILRCAVAVGKGEPGAVPKAKRARQLYEAAVEELRRAERARGRQGSIAYVRAKIGQHQHSENARNTPNTVDWSDALRRTLEELGQAVW